MDSPLSATLGDSEDIDARALEELAEALAQVVVFDRPRLPSKLILHGGAVVHVVGRIEEGHVRQAAGQDLLHHLYLGGIAAKQTVGAQQPDITGNSDCGLRRFRNGIFVGLALGNLFRFAQQGLEFRIGKAHQIEIEIFLPERFQFHPEHLFIPAGIERQPVVSQHQRAPLRFCQMVQDDNRNFGHAQLAGGQQARVTGNHDPVRCDQERICPAEFPDGRRDLCHLLVGVRARIAHIGQEPIDRPNLNLQMREIDYHDLPLGA